MWDQTATRLQTWGLHVQYRAQDHRVGTPPPTDRDLWTYSPPASAQHGKALYLNTGSCIGTGEITGLEIVSGLISQVRWSAAKGEMKRELLSHPRRLQVFA
jgi:hypothetical protein